MRLITEKMRYVIVINFQGRSKGCENFMEKLSDTNRLIPIMCGYGMFKNLKCFSHVHAPDAYTLYLPFDSMLTNLLSTVKSGIMCISTYMYFHGRFVTPPWAMQ